MRSQLLATFWLLVLTIPDILLVAEIFLGFGFHCFDRGFLFLLLFCLRLANGAFNSNRSCSATSLGLFNFLAGNDLFRFLLSVNFFSASRTRSREEVKETGYSSRLFCLRFFFLLRLVSGELVNKFVFYLCIVRGSSRLPILSEDTLVLVIIYSDHSTSTWFVSDRSSSFFNFRFPCFIC